MGRLHGLGELRRGGLWMLMAGLVVLVLLQAGSAAAQCCACDGCSGADFCVNEIGDAEACALFCSNAGCPNISSDDMDSCESGCGGQPVLSTATASQTPTVTGTPTGTATATITATPTAQATNTVTSAATATATATATGTSAATATVTVTGAATATATSTGQATATATVTAEATATATATSTGQATATTTSTGQATATTTSTGEATATATVTNVVPATPTVTATGQATATNTVAGQPTATATATSTDQATATRTATGTTTPTLPGEPAVLNIGDASGQPGRTVGFAVFLASDGGHEIVAARNCIEVDLDVPFASVIMDGVAVPDCTTNPAIDKDDSAFAFAPAGCNPTTTCESMCADIRGEAALPLIIEGSMLYSCRIAIPADAEVGNYALTCGSQNSATDADGGQVPVTCNSGEVIVQRNLPGDCNGDGMVIINELILGVNISLNLRPITDCPAFDTDDSGTVSVAELIAAVNVALFGG